MHSVVARALWMVVPLVVAGCEPDDTTATRVPLPSPAATCTNCSAAADPKLFPACNASCREGCCGVDGVCQAGDSRDACGRDGDLCLSCGAAGCIDGACTGGAQANACPSLCGGCCTTDGACRGGMVKPHCGGGGNACTACDGNCEHGRCCTPTGAACTTGEECCAGRDCMEGMCL